MASGFREDGGELERLRNKESLQRFFRHKKKRRSFRSLAHALIFLSLGAAFVFVCFAVFFRVRAVEVVGAVRYTPEQIRQVCGFEEGQSLYGVSGDLSRLHERLPYIGSAKLTRKLPYTLIVTVAEDEAAYYCGLYGEYFALSEDLRVLERADEADAFAGEGCVELLLPEIDSAVVGDRIIFSLDSDEKYVKAYLDVLQTNVLRDRVTAFDLRDKFDLKLQCDSIYLVELADGADLATKLTTTAAVLAETAAFPEGVSAKIDVTNPASPSAIVSKRVDISFDQ